MSKKWSFFWDFGVFFSNNRDSVGTALPLREKGAVGRWVEHGSVEDKVTIVSSAVLPKLVGRIYVRLS